MPKALPIYQTVQGMYRRGLISKLPAWHAAMRLVPPAQMLPREVCRKDVSGLQPFEAQSAGRAHYEEQIKSLFATRAEEDARRSKPRTAAKHTRPKKMRPQRIVFPEDRLRQRFYKQHPLELVRAQTLAEDESVSADYNTPLNERANVNGEDVIQHQLYLISQGHTVDEAYEAVTREFHAIRIKEEAAEAKERKKVLDAAAKIPSMQTQVISLAPMYPINAPFWRQEEEVLGKNEEAFHFRQDARMRSS